MLIVEVRAFIEKILSVVTITVGRGTGKGKILLVGGYTVLEHPNQALVLSVENAKIHAISTPHNRWEVISSYGSWNGADPHNIPDSLRFVRHAILESEVTTPHRVYISERGLFASKEKLGLGSSAAVTVAVVRSLRTDLPHHEVFKRAYRAHSNAQGKIGSGFDVASAVYGSIVYTRSVHPTGEGARIVPISIPRELVIRFFNVVGKGTSTAVSARKVMQAVKSSRDVRNIYEELARENDTAIKLFIKNKLEEFLESLKRINILRRRLGEHTGVPIEPIELDKVREQIEKMGYVTVLPGAGGYDSIVAVGIKGISTPKQFRLPSIKEVKIWLG